MSSSPMNLKGVSGPVTIADVISILRKTSSLDVSCLMIILLSPRILLPTVSSP